MHFFYEKKEFLDCMVMVDFCVANCSSLYVLASLFSIVFFDTLNGVIFIAFLFFQVLMQTHDHRHRLLQTMAKNINVWFIKVHLSCFPSMEMMLHLAAMDKTCLYGEVFARNSMFHMFLRIHANSGL